MKKLSENNLLLELKNIKNDIFENFKNKNNPKNVQRPKIINI